MALETDEIFLGDNGVAFDKHARFRDARTLKRLRGRYVQIRLVNDRGRARLTGLQIEARTGARETRELP